MFFSCCRGVSLLSNGVPWAMQSALYGSVYYYCAGVSAGARAGGVVFTVGFQTVEMRRLFAVRLPVSRFLFASSAQGTQSGHFLRFSMVVVEGKQDVRFVVDNFIIPKLCEEILGNEKELALRCPAESATTGEKLGTVPGRTSVHSGSIMEVDQQFGP